MDTVNQALPGGSILGKIIFAILGLVALYYLYQFLFSSAGLESKTLLTSISTATPADLVNGYVFNADKLPAIYEGGEMSINTWVYVNNYTQGRGLNKPVVVLGGNTFATLAVFLQPYKNGLSVRVNTTGSNAAAVTSTASSQANQTNLSTTALPALFTVMQPEGSLIDSPQPCDIPSIDLQKWVQVTIVLNNKTCDVYLDGKLARSCILPSFYRVDLAGLKLMVAPYGGFGGFVSSTTAYNYALNPEQVWRLYMSGPGSSMSLGDYLKSLFDPNALTVMEYPKAGAA